MHESQKTITSRKTLLTTGDADSNGMKSAIQQKVYHKLRSKLAASLDVPPFNTLLAPHCKHMHATLGIPDTKETSIFYAVRVPYQ